MFTSKDDVINIIKSMINVYNNTNMEENFDKVYNLDIIKEFVDKDDNLTIYKKYINIRNLCYAVVIKKQVNNNISEYIIVPTG